MPLDKLRRWIADRYTKHTDIEASQLSDIEPDEDVQTHAELMQAQLGKLEIADRHARHIAQSLFHIRDIEFVCGDGECHGICAKCGKYIDRFAWQKRWVDRPPRSSP